MKLKLLLQALLLASLPMTCVPSRAETLATHSAIDRETEVLHAVGPVHDLPAYRAHGTRAVLQGTVTYYDPNELFLFIQDNTGGIFVDIGEQYPVHIGDLVQVEGSTAPGFRTEITSHPRITVLGHGKIPVAVHASYADLMSGRLDCKLAKIRGIVRAANVEQHEKATLVHLDMAMPGGAVQVYLPVDQVDRFSLLDATVDLTGVVGGAFDASQQLTGVVLYGKSLAAIHVISRPTTKLTTYALSSPDDIAQYYQVLDTSRRLRIRGTVTSIRKGEFVVLQTEGRGLFVETRQTSGIEIGDVVDAYGFASDREYAPSLRLATIVDTGMKDTPRVQLVSYAEAFSGRYSDQLIRISGRLVSQLHEVQLDTLTLDVDGHLVRAEANLPKALPHYPVGSQLSLTGICRIIPGGAWREPSLFRLEMRSAADVDILLAPSWWTVKHLSFLLGGCTFLAIAVSGWATSLRRRVRAQTQSLERSVVVARERSHLLEMLSSNRALAEILQQISQSLNILLPTTSCVISLSPPRSTPSNSSKPTCYYEAVLLDCHGKTIGTMRIYCDAPADLPEDAFQVCKVLGDLAILAGRQSSFHQGLIYHSTHDVLTKLPNRRLLDQRLSEVVETASANHLSFSLIYIDVNKFKVINDRYGHSIGDMYLCELGARFNTCARATDTLARVGGDEFVLMASPMEREAGLHLVERLRSCFEQPFSFGAIKIQGSASFGLAVFPEDGRSLEDLKRLADHAMYADKRRSEDTKRGLGLAVLTPEEVKSALSEARCHLVYQPQFTAQGRLSGIEALLRVDDPILGVLSPGTFIQAAEESDTIIELGHWVLQQAVRDALRWKLHAGDHLVLAVNVAARQAQQPNFAENILRFLESVEFPPSRLELELVERSLAVHGHEINQQLHLLRQAGVRVALDDFGTGESSLTMLHKLPIDTIKIDRAFTSAIPTEAEVLPVIKAITEMALALDKRLVLEGIESASIFKLLPNATTMQFQGYLLSLPVKSAIVSERIEAWRSGINLPALQGAEFDTPTPLRRKRLS